MESKILLSFFLIIGGSLGAQFRIYNGCSFTVWPGIQGKPGHAHLENGGFKLDKYEAKFIDVPSDWAGRIWGRTNCDGSGRCETGDCGNKIQCNGAGGAPPASLAEVTLKGIGGLDFYDISFADGYNLPIKMEPTGGYIYIYNGDHPCEAAGCNVDLNAKCPNELAIKNSSGYTVACKSACKAFNTDQYCCRGAYNTVQTCKSSNWPVNYQVLFKSICPDAYSYVYDDSNSLFSCLGSPEANYDIVFCP